MRTILHISFSHVNGGYQPAQKWFKDRKGKVLSFDDAKHYHKIIEVLGKRIGLWQRLIRLLRIKC